MTYEKAIEALIAAGFLSGADREKAQTALASTRTDLTYPAWAKALADADLIRPADAPAAAKVMEQAGRKEDRDDLESKPGKCRHPLKTGNQHTLQAEWQNEVAKIYERLDQLQAQPE